MKMRLWLLGLLGAVSLLLPAGAQAMVPNIPQFYIVRHFDTPSGVRDPDLLPEGRGRAERLARDLRRNPPTAIYVTDFKRSRQTAEAVARRFRLTPIVYDPADTPALIERVRRERRPVLIVGHSNTVPDIVEALGGQRPAPLSHEDFGDLWTVFTNGNSSRTRVETR